MGSKLLCSATMSLDGFIAGVDGDMSWLSESLVESSPEIDDLMSTIGALLGGDRTFHGGDPNAGTELSGTSVPRMPPVTCHLRYEIDPSAIAAFERFARRWIALVERSGGQHHGYFLPSEGASDVAYAMFTFPSFAAYERYRERFGTDPDFLAADQIREESGCVRRYERSFLRPLLDGDIEA